MIQARNLSKVFRLPHAKKKTLYHNIISTVTQRYDYEQFYALQDISFDVRRGEFVGIMGRNGSGKSTLLKILAHIYRPTSGEVLVSEEVFPLLELGIGFQPDFTVRDNLYIYGSFLGFSRGEMDGRLGEILEYAELSRFVDAKLDNLSSGMKVRLAFSIAMQADAPAYLVDEVLAVGDRSFQDKCRTEFWRLKKSNRTVLFVSHAQADLLEFCDRILVFSHGRLVNQGEPTAMVDFYNSQSNGEHPG